MALACLPDAAWQGDQVDELLEHLRARGAFPVTDTWAQRLACLRRRQNVFPDGRLGLLRAQVHDAAPEGLEALLAAVDARRLPSAGGFEAFVKEATAAAARAAHLAPRALAAQGFAAKAWAEWSRMEATEALPWLLTARLEPRPMAPRWEGRLRREELPLWPELPCSAEIYGKGSDAAFRHPYVKALLQHARKRVSFGLDWVICVRTYGRSGYDPRSGKAMKKGIMSLTLKVLQELLPRECLRERLHVFVSHDDPHFVAGCYEKALGEELKARIIVGVTGADLQVRFIEECFCQGQHLVVCDDNVASLQRAAPSDRRMPAALGPLDLPQQVLEARRQMQRHEAHLWGVSPTHNLIYVNHSPELKTGLGLIYGAFFGFIVLHERELYTQYGQVKDDLERTLRYWRRDLVVLRFGRVVCKKASKPGKFFEGKAGISASLPGHKHKAEANDALIALSKTFNRCVRLPSRRDQKTKSTGEKVFLSDRTPAWNANVSGCGMIFLRNTLTLSKASPHLALRSGFCCPCCRGTRRGKCYCVKPLEEEAWLCFRDDAQCALQDCAVGGLDWQRFQCVAQEEWAKMTAGQREEYEIYAAKKLEREQWTRKRKR